MQYRVNLKNGDRLSALAFGCMRLGKDEEENARLLARAMEKGVNYFDTAYIYPGNEAALGRALVKIGGRDKVKLATKLPPYMVKRISDAEKILGTQLARLQTPWIDYYLIHMLPGPDDWRRLVDLGLLDWLNEKKRDGVIKNIGFSFHGGREAFKALVDAYSWDFCMIQLNYFDENNQAGKEGLLYAAGKGMPVMIMEPLRGGKLTKLPKAAMDVWDSYPVKRSPAEWSFRWLWNHPEVTTVLSGMTNAAVLEENLLAAEVAEAGVLTPEELALYGKVKAAILDHTLVPCTGCRYCMPCPSGVDIPNCFDNYNAKTVSRLTSRFFYIIRTNGHNAGLCTGCGKCGKHCPQAIFIPERMADIQKSMEGFYYKPLRFIVKRFMKMG